MVDPLTRSPMSCSVVVPVKDDAAELRGLLDVLARQTVPPLEIIVVDNASTDESAQVATEAGCRVVSEPRPGIAAAAAAGYDAARGDLILRCDADSRPGPTWVAAHRTAHLTRSRRRPALPRPPGLFHRRRSRPRPRPRHRVVAVTGPARFRLPFPLDLLTSVLYLGGYVLATGAALGHVPLFGTTMSVRRSWWQDVRGSVSTSPDVHDDMDLSFRVRPHETVRYAPSVMVRMSPRALRWGRLADVRFSRAAATLRRAWAEQTPWDRWAARLEARGIGGGEKRTRRPQKAESGHPAGPPISPPDERAPR